MFRFLLKVCLVPSIHTRATSAIGLYQFFSKLENPRPSEWTGEQTLGQLTLHLPPCMFSFPTHRKRRLVLSISWRDCFCCFITVIMYVGMALTTLFIIIPPPPNPACIQTVMAPIPRDNPLSYHGWTENAPCTGGLGWVAVNQWEVCSCPREIWGLMLLCAMINFYLGHKCDKIWREMECTHKN